MRRVRRECATLELPYLAPGDLGGSEWSPVEARCVRAAIAPSDPCAVIPRDKPIVQGFAFSHLVTEPCESLNQLAELNFRDRDS